MEEIIFYVGSTTNDNDVNALATKQLEESQVVDGVFIEYIVSFDGFYS